MIDAAFVKAFRVVVGEEGGFSDSVTDPGNWTGGQCGAGRCAGTKFGVSAAAYPGLNIGRLTLADAQEIYRRDYWEKVSGAALPPPLALLVFDAAVNNGVVRAVRWLQIAVGTKPDGLMGERTLAAVRAAGRERSFADGGISSAEALVHGQLADLACFWTGLGATALSFAVRRYPDGG